MKKEKLKIIIAIIITAVLCSSLSVFAYSYLASDVSYKKSDGNEISVKEALDELYDNHPKTAILLGSDEYDSTHYYAYQHTYDLTSYLDYKSFTEKNFICELQKISAMQAYNDSSSGGTISKSYDAEKGILTVSLSKYKYSGWGTIANLNIYLVK